MKPRIMIVDDESAIREICSEALRKWGFDIVATGDPVYALNASLKDSFDLVITDLKMPKMNGIELMQKVRKVKPSMPFIVITGYGSYDMAIDALREGASDFINKPFRLQELEISVRNTFEKVEILKELSRLKALSHIFQASESLILSRDKIQAASIILKSILKETDSSEGIVFLEDNSTGNLTKLLSIPEKIDYDIKTVNLNYKGDISNSNYLSIPLKTSDKTIGIVLVSKKDSAFTQSDLETAALLTNQLGISLENIFLFENLREKASELEDLFFSTVKALNITIDAKSPWTKGHSENVTKYSLIVANELNFNKDLLDLTELSAILHDIGKIGTYDYLLDKPGKLTPDEYKLVKKHPEKGVAILSPIRQMKDVVKIIRHHHERFDGTGYPDSISGDNIPLISKIISVADAYDSMTSIRPYRKTPGIEKAVEELKKGSGSQFDPLIVQTFIKAIKINLHLDYN